MGQRFPLPITKPMLTPADEHAAKPRYHGEGAASDWHGGQGGNDVDVASATQAVANSGSSDVETDYEPQHQEEKAEDMKPPMEILFDIGKDYSDLSGETGRSGGIEPHAPYPTAPQAVEP